MAEVEDLALAQLNAAMRQRDILSTMMDAQVVAGAVGTYYRSLIEQGLERDAALSLSFHYQMVALHGDGANAIMRRIQGGADDED